MPMKAVLFDAGNTLIFISREATLPVLREAGAQVDERSLRAAECVALELVAGMVDENSTGMEDHIWKEYFATLFRESGVPEEKLEEVGTRLGEIHQEKHLWTHVEPGTVDALESLRAAGIRMGVISNADGRVESAIIASGLRDYFEFVMDSELEGVAKPDPEIFLRACRRMELDPPECLYVGDLYQVDVMGARGAGLHAVLLDPEDRHDFPVDRIPSVAHLPVYLDRLSRGD
jgi:putative hydrolase of the HAD superfamily